MDAMQEAYLESLKLYNQRLQEPNETALRGKALMYAVQTYGHSLDSFSVLNIAEDYLVFLRGDAK